jgi:hypothetical protein
MYGVRGGNMQEMQKEQHKDGIMYRIGKANILIVTPIITEEERSHRLEEIKKMLFHLLYNNNSTGCR